MASKKKAPVIPLPGVSLEQKSETGPYMAPPAPPDRKNSLQIFTPNENSLGLHENSNNSLQIHDNRGANSLGIHDDRGANSLGIHQDQPNSLGIHQNNENSLRVHEEQGTSLRVHDDQQQSSVQIHDEESQSVGLHGEQPSSVSLHQEQASSLGLHQEQASSVSIQYEQPSSVALQHEMMQSVGLHKRTLTGFTLYDKNAAQHATIDAFSLERFGQSNREDANGFFIRSAANTRTDKVQGAVTTGVTLALSSDLKSEKVLNASELTASSYVAAGCRLRHIGFTYNNNFKLLYAESPSFSSVVPTKLRIITDASVSGNPGSGMHAFFPRSTIVSPMQAFVSKATDFYANVVVGPFYVPFVTNADTGCTITVTQAEDDTLAAMDEGDFAIYATDLLEYGPGWDKAKITDMYSLPAFFRKVDGDSVVDTMGETYLLSGADKLLTDRITYHDGWLYTGAGAGAVNLFASVTQFTFSLQPVIGFTEVVDVDNANANGNGLYMLVLENIESGTWDTDHFVADGTNKFVRITEPYNIYFAKPRYFPAGLDTFANMHPILDDAGRSTIYWDATQTLTNYPVCNLTSDVELALSTGSIAASYDGESVTARSWLSVCVDGTYYHPENLPWVYHNLPAAASAVSYVSVMISEPHYVAAQVRFGSTDALLVARRADAFGMGVILLDKGEREQWIASLYLYNDYRYMADASACVGFNKTTGPIKQGLGDHSIHIDDPSGEYTNKPTTLRPARMTLYAGNRAFVDEIAGSYTDRFSFGQTNTVFLPYAADSAVFGIQEALSYGIRGLCLPLLLPSVTVVPRTLNSPVLSGAPAYLGMTNICRLYGINSKQWNYQSGELWVDTDSNILPSTGTLICYSTPLIRDGVYASTPTLLESYVGNDLLQQGAVLGSRRFTFGQASYVQVGYRVYRAGKFLLNPQISEPLTDAEGTAYSGADQLLLEGATTSTLSFFSYRQDTGLIQHSSISGTRISNVVIVNGAMIFATSDGLYAVIEGRPMRLYAWDTGKTWGIGYIASLAGGNLLVMVIATDTTTVYLHIDEHMGISTTTSSSDTSAYSKLIRDTGTLPQLLFTKGTGASYENKQLSGSAASALLSLESNQTEVARDGYRFVLTGVQLSYSVANPSKPFDTLKIYNESGGTEVCTVNGEAGSIGTFTVLHTVGVIPSRALKWKMSSINSTLALYGVRFVGHYTRDII